MLHTALFKSELPVSSLSVPAFTTTIFKSYLCLDHSECSKKFYGIVKYLVRTVILLDLNPVQTDNSV